MILKKIVVIFLISLFAFSTSCKRKLEPISTFETEKKANEVKNLINSTAQRDGEQPLVFFTFVNHELSEIIKSSCAVCYDFLSQYSDQIAKELKVAPVPKVHRTHSMHDKSYDFRIDAVNYALTNDDGANIKNYAEADIIIDTGDEPMAITLQSVLDALQKIES